MPARIPISAAKSIADKYGCRQVIVLAFDPKGRTHIITYGKTADDCAQAAEGGNILKQKWGWPECNDQPSRVKKLEAKVEELRNALDVYATKYGKEAILSDELKRKLEAKSL